MSHSYIPPELISEITGHLSPVQDRSALATLMRVSQLCWELVAPELYRTVKVDPSQLHLLLAGNVDKWDADLSERQLEKPRSHGVNILSRRGQRTFSMIHNLELNPPPNTGGICELWHASSAATPLFPNVRCLRLRHPDGPTPSCQCHLKEIDSVPDENIVQTNRNVNLFDPNLEVCVHGYFAQKRIPYLVKTASRVTCHDVLVSKVVSNLPPLWQQRAVDSWHLRVFLASAAAFGQHYTDVVEYEQTYSGKIDLVGRVPLMLEVFIMSDLEEKYWNPQLDNRVKIVFDDRLEQPCSVCGAYTHLRR